MDAFTTVRVRNRCHRLLGVRRRRGMSLIIVLLILVVVSLLGIGGIQVSMMGERSARNDRDSQIAWQSAEVALLDAEFDMHGSLGAAPGRAIFDGSNTTIFTSGCGTSGNGAGLCAAVTTGKPAWLTARFTDTSSSSNTIAFGTFTGQAFPHGSAGVQPARVPRYIIEPVIDQVGSKVPGEQTLAYRVTAMGFGPRDDIQAVVQMLYRN